MESDVATERTPDGRQVIVARGVDAPREAAWDLLTDTERWPDWGPSVRAVECDQRFIQPGTTGRVRLPGGVWLPFEIATCAKYRWTWRVARVPATGHRVDPPAEGTDEGRCRIVFEIPPLAAGYVPVCMRALGRIVSLLEDNPSSVEIPAH
jgi:hypothetical protein